MASLPDWKADSIAGMSSRLSVNSSSEFLARAIAPGGSVRRLLTFGF
jgi:hypothetical protein